MSSALVHVLYEATCTSLRLHGLDSQGCHDCYQQLCLVLFILERKQFCDWECVVFPPRCFRITILLRNACFTLFL